MSLVGGPKPGAGRPRKTDPLALTECQMKKLPLSVLEELDANDVGMNDYNPNLTPLDYMLNVMRDPRVETSRRDRMAQAAAPFVHVKASDVLLAQGKKEQQKIAAETAGHGTAWGDDLTVMPTHTLDVTREKEYAD